MCCVFVWRECVLMFTGTILASSSSAAYSLPVLSAASQSSLPQRHKSPNVYSPAQPSHLVPDQHVEQGLVAASVLDEQLDGLRAHEGAQVHRNKGARVHLVLCECWLVSVSVRRV